MQSTPHSSPDHTRTTASDLKPRPPHPNISSTASLDSRIHSMESSHDPQSLHSILHSVDKETKTEHIFGSSPPQGTPETKSCPVTPRHSVSSQPPPLLPVRPSSASRYQAVFPKPLPLRRHSTVEVRSRGRQKRPSLPTLPEAKCLVAEFDSLNREFEETVREFRSQSLTSLNGDQTPPPQLSSPQARTQSDADAVKKKMVKTHKRTRSDGDPSVTINITYQSVHWCNHSQCRLDRGSEEDNDGSQQRDCRTPALGEEAAWDYVQEDLTKGELLQIANEINPDKACSLSALLHHSTHVWAELSHAHPPLALRDKIFSVLERWFENISESPENRRTLARACRSVDQTRIASRIASKSYS